MGTDMSVWVEQNDGNSWQPAYYSFVNDFVAVAMNVERSYDLFGALSGVRRENQNPLAANIIPDDVSFQVRRGIDASCADHSFGHFVYNPSTPPECIKGTHIGRLLEYVCDYRQGRTYRVIIGYDN